MSLCFCVYILAGEVLGTFPFCCLFVGGPTLLPCGALQGPILGPHAPRGPNRPDQGPNACMDAQQSGRPPLGQTSHQKLMYIYI